MRSLARPLRRRLGGYFGVLVLLAIGCARDAVDVQATHGVVDSAVPRAILTDSAARALATGGDGVVTIEESLRRFRADVVDTPTVFRGGAASREALVRKFAAALERADTAALLGMVQSRAEFAFLTYPSSPYTHPPYRQAPDIVWLQLRLASNKGITRLVRRMGGQPFGYVRHSCAPTVEREGTNTLWKQCAVRRVASTGDTVTQQLFGVIIERGGQFKFASYGNEL